MKSMAIAAAFLFVAGATGANAGMSATTGGGTCLQIRDVDHTHVVDATTVEFHMKNGAVWTNKLPAPCPGLKFHGFSYVAHDTDEVCSNSQGIRVLVTDQVCQLGAFTPAGGPHSMP
ncbi:MAG TPA: hypothetical protein VMH86_09220 [Rhizomicrobium sp.]|nr:hypothetical protein [Rhizomicrobium sp.]